MFAYFDQDDARQYILLQELTPGLDWSKGDKHRKGWATPVAPDKKFSTLEKQIGTWNNIPKNAMESK